MPVIHEENEGIEPPADFADLLALPDFCATTLSSAQEAFPTTTADGQTSFDFINQDSFDDWQLPEPAYNPYADLEEPDYAKFENWIPQFIRPEKPCDYCRVRRLNCYLTRGELSCTPCAALFRECSLTNTQTLEGLNSATGHLLDTLHVVDEDACKEQGSFTGIKPLRSKDGASSNIPVRLDDAAGSSKRNGIRFPKQAVKILRDWLDAHQDNPYPTEKQKVDLEQRTELKPSQIANWLANARRRRKVTERARKPLSSPSLGPTTPAIDILTTEKSWDELNPLERWKNSPPEHEPASIRDIANAVASSDLPDDQVSTSPSSLGRHHKRSSAGSRPRSTTSFETAQTSSISASTSAAWSQRSHKSHESSQSRGSFGSFSSGLAGKKDRRRRRRPAHTSLQKPEDVKRRIFQCTFCTDTFKSKYDWTRHEKSLHLSLEKWICAPLGPVITDPVTGLKRCVYCDEQDPSDDHVETHNYRQCEEKGLDARTFYRKDHLRQHLRLMHGCEMTQFMDNWKSTAININSRCGFCAKRFTIWQERVDHLTAHFKSGARMTEWKGCRGLDPAVAAQVTNAMPPYLIGIESVSPVPFSATNTGTWRSYVDNGFTADFGNLDAKSVTNVQEQADMTGLPAKATCWEILTVRLGRYANEMSKQGVVLTDEMLQSKARHILFDSDDIWDQTAADNPEWLDLFKKAHGLDFIPSDVGGQGVQIPEDLETYQDLGLRVPFAVQLQAFNATQSRQAQEADIERKMMAILSKEGVLHDSATPCRHSECEENVLDLRRQTPNSTASSSYRRWCTYQLPPSEARKVADLRRTALDPSEQPFACSAAASADRVTQDMNSLRRLGQHRSDVQAHHRGLATLSNAEGMMEPITVMYSGKKPFLQRHRYELPRERARQFATVTGPWTDSGAMPAPITTSAVPTIENTDTISTGAMMEFLGGELGQDLPFSGDANTSTISISDLDWTYPTTTAARDAALSAELDLFLASTAAGQASAATSSNALFATNDTMMPNMNMDFDMDFDGVFDMGMDDGTFP